ncbi:MAG: ABC transporter substrate-binding protein [Acidobacteriota bacterium]
MTNRSPINRFRGLPGVLAVLLLAVGCGGQEESPSAGNASRSNPKLVLGYPAVSATIFPIVYAQEKGIFEEEGVEVEMSRIRGIPQIVATLLNVDIDLGWMGFDGMANAVVEGVEELRYIGEFLTELPQSLVVAPTIATFEDLRGQPVATAGPGTLTDTLFTEGLMRGGLANPRQETQYLHLPGQASRLTQLLTGTVVASSLKVPATQKAEQEGFRTLQYQGNLLEPWSGEGFVTHTSILSSKGEALRSFLRSIARAIREMEANKDEAAQVAATYLELDPVMAGKVYDAMMPIFNADGTWKLEGIQRMFDSRSGPDQKIDAARFLDDSLLE